MVVAPIDQVGIKMKSRAMIDVRLQCTPVKIQIQLLLVIQP